MEDYKVAIFEYLSNDWSVLSQILNLGLYNQSKFSKFSDISNKDDLKWIMTSNGRLPKIAKIEYLSNYWSDVPQILYLSLYDQTNLS